MRQHIIGYIPAHNRLRSHHEQNDPRIYIRLQPTRLTIPSSSISIHDFCTFIAQNRAFADSYIEYLIRRHSADGASHCLGVALHIPQHAGLFEIQIQFPSGALEETFQRYYNHPSVSFGPYSQQLTPPNFTRDSGRLDFVIQPTLLFLHRTLVLFLEAVGPNRQTNGDLICSVVMNVLEQKFTDCSPEDSGEVAQLRKHILGRFCNKAAKLKRHENGSV